MTTQPVRHQRRLDALRAEHADHSADSVEGTPDTQEDPENWKAKLLVDLETGQRWQAHTEVTYHTTWEGP